MTSWHDIKSFAMIMEAGGVENESNRTNFGGIGGYVIFAACLGSASILNGACGIVSVLRST